ncbi:hypothetical protein CesoFtcFv8_010662 [Champsocephalus esox]|uniref:Uncharacterized protein n=1 Tax=Champsocephalus esox TaxID=159716 RepID=A0AAN8C864_9TELE|nr:hypothetical protein CesoFtcFv8_010662 [Champsocephalus esox]
MYAFYIVARAQFDFNETNMQHIRNWWCRVLLKDFPMPSQDCKRRREEKAMQDEEVVRFHRRSRPSFETGS